MGGRMPVVVLHSCIHSEVPALTTKSRRGGFACCAAPKSQSDATEISNSKTLGAELRRSSLVRGAATLAVWQAAQAQRVFSAVAPAPLLQVAQDQQRSYDSYAGEDSLPTVCIS